ncbi:hypothetical protein ACFQV8_34070 [Pseudonocardia benzenivorans]
MRLPWATPDELAAAHDFADLQSFLDVYYAVMAVLCTPADFADVADAYLARAAAKASATSRCSSTRRPTSPAACRSRR